MAFRVCCRPGVWQCPNLPLVGVLWFSFFSLSLPLAPPGLFSYISRFSKGCSMPLMVPGALRLVTGHPNFSYSSVQHNSGISIYHGPCLLLAGLALVLHIVGIVIFLVPTKPHSEEALPPLWASKAV